MEADTGQWCARRAADKPAVGKIPRRLSTAASNRTTRRYSNRHRRRPTGAQRAWSRASAGSPLLDAGVLVGGRVEVCGVIFSSRGGRARASLRQPDRPEIRSPVAASSSNSGRHLAGTSSRRRMSSARVRKRRSRVDQARPARRRGNTTCSAGLASISPSATAASSARRSGVRTLAIERSYNRPWRPGRVVSQSTKPCTAATVEVAHPDLAVEVRQRECDQQPAILTARVRAHASCPVPA